jgi:acyl-CoA thioester hydrolase
MLKQIKWGWFIMVIMLSILRWDAWNGLETLGFHTWMEENGMLPVVSLNINYKKPARYDDLLTVKTIFKSQSTVKIEFDYEIYNEQRELLTIASSIWFCEYENRSSDRSSDYVSEKF